MKVQMVMRMPFTPFHLGPALLLGLVFFSYIDFPTFLVANIIVDIEPFVVLTLDLDYPLHGFMHSFLGGAFLAFLVAMIMGRVRKRLSPMMESLRLEQKASLKTILLASFSGTSLHVLLDSPLYPEMRPFYPFATNPFLGRNFFISFEVYTLCALSFIGGIVIHIIRLRKPKEP